MLLQVRKKTSQISSLDRQLDEKVCEVTEQVSKVAELEEDVTQKTTQLQKLRSEVEQKGRAVTQCKAKADKLRNVHREQMQEMEGHIEMVRVPLFLTPCTVIGQVHTDNRFPIPALRARHVPK